MSRVIIFPSLHQVSKAALDSSIDRVSDRYCDRPGVDVTVPHWPDPQKGGRDIAGVLLKKEQKMKKSRFKTSVLPVNSD